MRRIDLDCCRGKSCSFRGWLAGLILCSLIVTLASAVEVRATGNENSFMYIDCGQTLFSPPGPNLFCFDLRYHIEGTGVEKVVGFFVPLVITSSGNAILSIDTTVASAFPVSSGVSGFDFKEVRLWGSGPDSFHIVYGAVNFALEGVTGDSLFARICVQISDTGEILIDTLFASPSGSLYLVDEYAGLILPGWGSPKNQLGYPPGGASCLADTGAQFYATGTGVGVMGDFKSHIDTYYDSYGYQLKDVTRRLNTNPHGHNGKMSPYSSIATYLSGAGLVADSDNTFDDSAQGPAVDAHVYAGWTYDYILDTLGRNGFDGLGKNMYSVVEDTVFNEPVHFDTTSDILYITQPDSGNRSAAAAIDYVARGWGFGITKYASRLKPDRESGALSESFADMLGVAVGFATNDPDWQLGENISLAGIPESDLEDPTATQQPDTLGALFWIPADSINCPISDSANDFCGVHKNSGVPNKVFNLLSVGGNHYGVNVGGIGINNAMRIMYRANKLYWDSTTDFVKAAGGTFKAARDLDSTGTWARKAAKAWEAVRVCKAIPGDANDDRKWTLADAISIFNHIARGGLCSPQPLCWLSGLECRGDCNGDGIISFADVIWLVNRAFQKPCPYPNLQPSTCWDPLPSDICCKYP